MWLGWWRVEVVKVVVVEVAEVLRVFFKTKPKREYTNHV